MSSVHVLSIQALEELKGALSRFGAETLETLTAAEIELRRTLDWLQERMTHWRNEVNRRKEMLARAQAALARCRAATYRDPKTGAVYVPPCIAEQEAVHQAQINLAQAEAELRNVQEWTRLVQQAADDYQRQAQRLKTWVHGDLPQANAFLERKITTLHSYVTMGVPPGATFVTTPPTHAVADAFATGIGIAALGVGLTAAAIAVTRWLAHDVRHALGAVGEELSARLLREQPGFRELPFDPPKHGFDRVFTAPGLPLIVMESKVTSTGAFHPGQTQHGQQGSPEWIAAQADKMGDPASAQSSPLNERIAALVKELGPENVPAVAVVIQSETGLADVYCRPVDAEEWQPLRQGVALTDALAGAGGIGAHPEVEANPKRERKPESLEGPAGGLERG